MKHILLITFYYPPYTGIEGNRLKSWSAALSKAGFKVTVLTRQWQAGAQNTWADYVAEYADSNYTEETVSSSLRVIRLPHRWTNKYKAQQRSKLAGVHYWKNKLLGRFHIETDAYNSFYEAARQLLREEPVDLMIVSSPPLNIIRLGHELKKASGVPYLADFRDSYNNYKLNPDFRPTAKQRAESYLFKSYLNRWLSNADAIISVDKAVADTINPHFSQPVVVIRNGFELDLFRDIDVAADSATFRLTVTGNMYPEQDIAFLAKGIGKFIADAQPEAFMAQFIGLRDRQDVADVLRQYIPEAHLLLLPRLPRTEALKAMRQSQILLQAGWRGYKGWLPGKVFEYMAAGRNILIAPSDRDIIDRVIKETGTGFSADTIEDMARYLTIQYRCWQRLGTISYNGNKEAIAVYSREVQNAKLIEFINEIF